jgi:hypothetical protein
MPIAVKDLDGKVVFHIDGEVAKDANGKTVAEPSSLKSLRDDEKLSILGSLLMRDRAGTPEGRQVLMDLAIGDVATARTIAEYGVMVDGCVADVVSAPRLIPHDRGVWYVENTTDVVKVEADYTTSAGGSYPVANPQFTPTTFATVNYALGAKIPRRTMVNADWDLRARTLRFLIEALRIRRELRIAQAVTTTANWNAKNQITVAAGVGKWNGGANSDPLADLFAGKAATAMPVTHMILPESVSPYFFAPGANNRVRDFVQAGGGESFMPKVLNAGAIYQTGGVNGYVWAPSNPVNVALVRISSDPTMVQTAQTFRWLGDSKDGSRTEGVLVRTFFDPREECDWIVVTYNDFDTLLTTASAPPPQVGSLIVGALQ